MKKIIALCTAFTLLILACCVVPISSAQEVISDSETLQPTYTNKLNKIHFYFATENETDNSVATMSTPEKAAEVPQFAYIDSKAELGKAINNMNSYCESAGKEDEPINVTVEFKSGFEDTEEYAAFQQEKQTIKTLEEVRDYRRRLAAFSKEFHRRENETNIKKLGFLDYENLEIIDYCPFVELEINKNDISSADLLKLANDSKISNVSLSSNNIENIEDHEISWDRALKEIEAFDMVMVGGYSGSGIKIGILEKGVCYPDNEYLSNKTIHFDPTSTYDDDNDHIG